MSQKVNYENLFAARRQGDGRHRIKKVRVRKTDKSYFDDENGTRWSRLDLDKQPQDGRVGAYQSAKGDVTRLVGLGIVYIPQIAPPLPNCEKISKALWVSWNLKERFVPNYAILQITH